MTPSIAATITTANRGAAIASAAPWRDANGSKETTTSWRLAKAKPSRTTAMTATTTSLRKRTMQASFDNPSAAVGSASGGSNGPKQVCVGEPMPTGLESFDFTGFRAENRDQ